MTLTSSQFCSVGHQKNLFCKFLIDCLYCKSIVNNYRLLFSRSFSQWSTWSIISVGSCSFVKVVIKKTVTQCTVVISWVINSKLLPFPQMLSLRELQNLYNTCRSIRLTSLKELFKSNLFCTKPKYYVIWSWMVKTSGAITLLFGHFFYMNIFLYIVSSYDLPMNRTGLLFQNSGLGAFRQ